VQDFTSLMEFIACSICCGFVVQQIVRLVVKFGFAMDLLHSFSTCCGQVQSHTPLFPFVVDLSKSYGFVVDLLHKLQLWSLKDVLVVEIMNSHTS
jgi:hypothetical protein